MMFLSDGGDTGSVKLKEGPTPKEIDIASDSSGAILGIYEFRDGHCALPTASMAPAAPDFAAAAGSSSVSFTYQRK
jgi:hypothetical protein